jgi:hypothetical protein
MKLEKNTLKRIQYIALTLSLLGPIVFTTALMFSEELSDFLKGFLGGLSFVMIITWGVYLIWCIINKRNPYRIIE